MGNKVPVFCPYEILDKYNNGSIWRSAPPPKPTTVYPTAKTILDGLPFDEVYHFFRPFIGSKDSFLFTDLVALIMIFVVLLLNRKRWVQSRCLYLFTNYFLAFLILRTGSRFLHNLYLGLWNIAKYRFAWCHEESYDNGTIKGIKFAQDPEDTLQLFPIEIRINGYNIYYFFEQNSSASRIVHNHLSATFLIIHRLTIYCAVAQPLIFKKHFNKKRLRLYYCLTGCIWMLYGYGYYFLPNGYSLHSNVFLPITKYLTVIACVFHLIISVLSIRAIIKFNKSCNSEVQAVKNFFIFSIYPVLYSIIDMFFGVSTTGAMFTISKDILNLWHVISSFLDIFYSFTTIISFLLFIPVYRKTFLTLFCKKGTATVSPA